MRRLLSRRDARVYLTGQGFSVIGDNALCLAMGIWVKILTGRPLALAATAAVGLSVDRLRGGLPGLGERADRRGRPATGG